jgi:hypothetical protein
MYFRYWYKEEVTTPTTCIQGLREYVQAEPLSTNTLPMVQSWHLTVMYRGLLWSLAQARLWWSIGSWLLGFFQPNAPLTWINLETPVTTHYMFQMGQGPRQKHWMHWFWRFQPSQIWRPIGVSRGGPSTSYPCTRGAQSNLISVMRWGENIAKETKKSYYNSETTWMARINGLHGRLQISLESAL